MSSKSFPVTSMSLTYTRMVVKEAPVCLINKEESATDWLKPKDSNAEDSFENHCLGACFRPYRDLISLHTLGDSDDLPLFTLTYSS